MNADRLLAHYATISEAPDAIPRLRQIILDVAVRGKLVPQSDDDEPAAELLIRTHIETRRRVNPRRNGKSVTDAQAGRILAPFAIPKNWVWVKLKDILVKLTDGTHHSPPNGPSGEYKYITAKNIRDEGVLLHEVTYVSGELHRDIFSRCNPEEGDILYIKDGATTGIVTINNLREPFSMLSSVALLKLPSTMFNRLVVIFLRSPFFYGQMRGFMKGAAITRVTLKRMEPALLPLPPFAEQHRIVAKVDELMGLCDRLEESRELREERRSRLTTLSFARLSLPEPETFQRDARFVIDSLPVLTARANQIKSLRRAVYDLAMRGKLVHQDHKEAPASELIAQVMKEVASYDAANQISRVESRGVNVEDMPFPAPNRWRWIRLRDIFKVITDGDHQPPPKADQGVAFLTIGNITTGVLDFTDCRWVPEEYYRSLPPHRTPARGDILYTVVGATYGRPALVETDREFCVQRHIAILKPCESLDARFLMLLLASPLVYDQASKSTTGTAQPTIPLRPLRNFVVPLPPREEQRRIVAKVDQLMTLCDQLERNLVTADETCSRLLSSLLAEALLDSSNAIAA